MVVKARESVGRRSGAYVLEGRTNESMDSDKCTGSLLNQVICRIIYWFFGLFFFFFFIILYCHFATLGKRLDWWTDFLLPRFTCKVAGNAKHFSRPCLCWLAGASYPVQQRADTSRKYHTRTVPACPTPVVVRRGTYLGSQNAVWSFVSVCLALTGV